MAIVGTTALALIGVQHLGWASSKPSWDLVAILALANLATYVWIRIGTHWTLPRQVSAVLLILAAQSIFWSLVRLDGFAGDGRIIFKPRWERTTEQRWLEFAERNAKAGKSAEFPPNAQDDSPAFRGADRSGEFQCTELDTNWANNPPRLLWRHPVGPGWSSFAVVGPYCVTQEQRDASESVVCYEVATGREVWQSSPMIHAGKVIVAGGVAGSLIAFSADRGNLLCRSGPRPAGYSSPQLVRETHGDQVLLLDGVGLYGHDMETGNELWSVEWGDSSDEYVNVGQPIILRTLDDASGYSVLISSGYDRGT
ncbi:MAG: PQQ-binding-like beta-propeller repeat protein [Pirellulales bacterium]